MPVFVSYKPDLVPNPRKTIPAWKLRHLNPDCETLRLTDEGGLNVVQNREKPLREETQRCRAFGCWDAYEAEYENGPVTPGVTVPKLDLTPTAGRELFDQLRARVPGRGYSVDPVPGHLIYLITPPGHARIKRRNTGYEPRLPECYIGETDLSRWPAPRLTREHLGRARSKKGGGSEFLVELVRQGYRVPFAEVVEYGHPTVKSAQAAERHYWREAQKLGWAATGGLIGAPLWRRPW